MGSYDSSQHDEAVAREVSSAINDLKAIIRRKSEAHILEDAKTCEVSGI